VDFTDVKLVTGVFVYVAFVIDAYAGAIVGWEISGSKHNGSSNQRSARPPHWGRVGAIQRLCRGLR
jgi:transposase InsO family protein